MKYFSLVMSLFYVVAGALILFTNLFPQVSRFRIPLGLILVVYGIVRGIMWRTKQVQSEEEQ